MRPHIRDGMSASELEGVHWRKSRHSNPDGSCVEVAPLSSGMIALRNSRFPDGNALVYTPAEFIAFIKGAKDGEFDDLV